jgi:hypothetical protein
MQVIDLGVIIVNPYGALDNFLMGIRFNIFAGHIVIDKLYEGIQSVYQEG